MFHWSVWAALRLYGYRWLSATAYWRTTLQSFNLTHLQGPPTRLVTKDVSICELVFSCLRGTRLALLLFCGPECELQWRITQNLQYDFCVIIGYTSSLYLVLVLRLLHFNFSFQILSLPQA